MKKWFCVLFGFNMFLLSTKVLAYDSGDISRDRTISGGYSHCAAIKNDGSLWTWGYSTYGALGSGLSDYESFDSPIKVFDNAKSVECGKYNTMIIKEDYSLWGCGSNQNYQLATERGTWNTEGLGCSFEYVKIMDDVQAVSLAGQIMAIKKDKSLWIWGYDGEGQLGDGGPHAKGWNYMDRCIPEQFMSDIKTVCAGNVSLVIKEDNSLWGWGWNTNGKLGNGLDDGVIYRPIKIMDNVIDVSVGVGHVLAIKEDGSLWAWGANSNGALGNGTTENSYLPIKVMDNVKRISAGAAHSMAIKEDGSLWVWGDNNFGQLGNSQKANSFEDDVYEVLPIKIMDNVVDICAGEYSYSMALTDDGNLYTWGLNIFGNIGNGKHAEDYDNDLNMCESTPQLIMTDVKIPEKVTAEVLNNNQSQILTEFGSVISKWAQDEILKAYEEEIISEIFSSANLTETINRAEFSTGVVNLYEKITNESVNIDSITEACFEDIKDNSLKVDILKAYKLNIIYGIGGGKFNPMGNITREEAATMLMRLAKTLNCDISSPKTDLKGVSNWAREGVNFVVSNKIMNGTENGFEAERMYTKEQAIISMLRFYENLSLFSN